MHTNKGELFKDLVKEALRPAFAETFDEGLHWQDVFVEGEEPSVFAFLDNDVTQVSEFYDDDTYDTKVGEQHIYLYFRFDLDTVDVEESGRFRDLVSLWMHRCETLVEKSQFEKYHAIDNSEFGLPATEIQVGSMAWLGSLPEFDNKATKGSATAVVTIRYTMQ